jgi:hypothetical protein
MTPEERAMTWAQKCYDEIIARARLRQGNKPLGYEWHHVTPKCLGGKDGETVMLTWREHFIVHWLLIKIHPDKPALGFVLKRMASGKVGRSSWRYVLAKKHAATARKFTKPFLGRKHSLSARIKMIKAQRVRRGLPPSRVVSSLVQTLAILDSLTH